MDLMKRIFAFTLVLFFNLINAQNNSKILVQDTLVDHNATKNTKWSLDFSGFIQADVIVDNKKLSYIDGYLPTYTESNKIDYNTYLTMRQSQFGLGITNNETGIRGFVQIDFIGPNNQNGIRLRKLFITYKNWMIGQDWSNLNDLDTWPNLLDFNGPNGALYSRRMQIRYTKVINNKKQYAISLEDPNIPSFTLPNNDLNWRKKTLFPNMIGAFKYGEHSYIRGAAILSPISYQKRIEIDADYNLNTTLGYGIHASSVLYVNKYSNFKLVAAAGNGIATNVIPFNDEGYDAIPNLNNPNRLKKLPVISGVGAYEHWWNVKWSSVLFYSYSKVGEAKYMSENMLKSVQHYGINTIFQPTSYFKTGFDFTYGYVEKYQINSKLESARLQISTVFSF